MRVLRARDRRLVIAPLAVVAGAVDVFGVIVLHGLFTAHMSGNTARLGRRLGVGELAAAVPAVVAIAAFIVSIAGASIAAELLGRRGVTTTGPLLAVEALALAAVAIAGAAAGLPSARAGVVFYVLLVLLVAAMGVQTAALPPGGGRSGLWRTTYISGTLTRLAQSLAVLATGAGPGGVLDRDAGIGDAGEARSLLARSAGVVAAYLAGGVGGAALTVRLHAWAAGVFALILLLLLLLLLLLAGVRPREA